MRVRGEHRLNDRVGNMRPFELQHELVIMRQKDAMAPDLDLQVLIAQVPAQLSGFTCPFRQGHLDHLFWKLFDNVNDGVGDVDDIAVPARLSQVHGNVHPISRRAAPAPFFQREPVEADRDLLAALRDC